MISELLEMVESLDGELFFYLEEGPLTDRIIERYMEKEDAHAEILEFEHNLSLRVKQGDSLTAPSFDCRLETLDFQYRIIFAGEDFAAAEISELIDYLRPYSACSHKHTPGRDRSIIRKKQGSELLNIAVAAKSLGLSHRSLKSLIPCTETRIVEKDGSKSIEEYYWDKVLIDRFENLGMKQQEGCGYNREDLAFIAESCCDGDYRWAHDCISSFLRQRTLSGSNSEDDA